MNETGDPLWTKHKGHYTWAGWNLATQMSNGKRIWKLWHISGDQKALIASGISDAIDEANKYIKETEEMDPNHEH